jgi:beta-ureidopropionase / N-carbamoyl-L-amino-acid hydrolase
VTTTPVTSTLRIDRERLLQRIQALHEIAPIEGGGNCRLALTDEDRAGRDLVVAMMRDLGLSVTVDAIGNVVATRAGREDGPPVMTGSHVDTVRTGGRYDGNLGVLAGLEVIETLAVAGVTTKRPLAVALFTGEEGARFHPDMLGSLVYAGGLSVEAAHDEIGIDGTRLGDELARIGYLGGSPCPGPVPYAFVELHVEQGPVLEREGVRIGAVESVQGICWTELTITGQSNHAGTTPMALRHDAGYVAAEVAAFVRRLVGEMGGAQVGTVGRLSLVPDLINVVAGRATLSVDLRNTDGDALHRALDQLVAFAHATADREGCSVAVRTLADFDPVIFDPRVVDLVDAAATGLGLSVRRMPSGAGHDAQMLARVCPTAMVFVPSVDGLSHNPAEHTEPDDLEAGANVLLHTLLTLAEE